MACIAWHMATWLSSARASRGKLWLAVHVRDDEAFPRGPLLADREAVLPDGSRLVREP